MIVFSITIKNKTVWKSTDASATKTQLKWIMHHFKDVAKKGDTVKMCYHYLNVEGTEIIDTVEEFTKTPPYHYITEGSP